MKFEASSLLKNTTIAIILFCTFNPALTRADILVANGSSIKLYNNDGTNETTLVEEASYGMCYEPITQKLYYVGPDQSIRVVERNGTGEQTLVSSAGTNVVDVAVDLVNFKLIWTDYYNALIKRSNLDGTNVENLVTGVSAPHGVLVDISNGLIYWAELGAISKASLDGSGVTPVVFDFDGGGYLSFPLLHDGKIYWTNYGDGSIKRANTDGTGVETLVASGQAVNVEGIGYDSSMDKLLYLGQPTTGVTLRSMNLDGSANAELASIRGYDIIPNYTTEEDVNGNTIIIIGLINSGSSLNSITLYILIYIKRHKSVNVDDDDSHINVASIGEGLTSQFATIDANGNFSIPGLAPGRYTVTLKSDAGTFSPSSFDINSDETLPSIVFTPSELTVEGCKVIPFGPKLIKSSKIAGSMVTTALKRAKLAAEKLEGDALTNLTTKSTALRKAHDDLLDAMVDLPTLTYSCKVEQSGCTKSSYKGTIKTARKKIQALAKAATAVIKASKGKTDAALAKIASLKLKATEALGTIPQGGYACEASS